VIEEVSAVSIFDFSPEEDRFGLELRRPCPTFAPPMGAFCRGELTEHCGMSVVPGKDLRPGRGRTEELDVFGLAAHLDQYVPQTNPVGRR
jgi:hypothetical protein